VAILRKYILLPVLLLLGLIPARASHIVGGEVSYRYLGNNRYEITVDIFQDCKDGLPEAIRQDNPALIGIYYNGGAYLPFQGGIDSITAPPENIIDVPANFSNACVTKAPIVCLKRIRFRREYTLPPNPLGYVVVYQRCCRNASIVNLNNPGNIGATYYCIIPPNNTAPQPNNSAKFTNFPPQIICVNEPLVYDHSATDVDGDSLSYEFCQAYAGGLPDDAKPLPQPPDPQFPQVVYAPPFSSVNPMGGSPRIQIDPVSGMITGTPTSVNRFVVTVCCHEWRNGVMINTVTREFQFVVADCKKAVVANTPVFSDLPNTYIVNCKDKTVQFKNTSIGGFEYFWELGIPGVTSTEKEPIYTYPDTGTYIVTLFVNKGSTCPDSISRIVKIYPNFDGEFSITGLLCPNNLIQFADSSTTTYGTINYWSWDFGDSEFDGNQYTAHRYKEGGIYKVILYSGNSLGCRDTVAKTIDVDRFFPYAGNDTIIVRGERIDFNATGGVEYSWTPGDQGLSNTNIPNPTAFYPDTGTYHYKVHIKSSYGCEGDAYVNVRVVSNPSFFVPNAFTPNGDGLNDFLRPRAVGYRSVDFFRVFNRFGELVFEGKDFSIGWDGRWKGQYADIGTYMYALKLTNRFGVVETAKGDVILMR
jgi:gliding motility-associated-like protein